MHLLGLAEEVKAGVVGAGMVGYRFNTIGTYHVPRSPGHQDSIRMTHPRLRIHAHRLLGVSDGISMGTSGMSFSLQSRDLIADSIETVMSGQWYDANVALPGPCACASYV
jgi:dihydroxy-acid dehydratase